MSDHVFLVYKSQRQAREIQILSSVMADDSGYHFSEEEEEEDALLDRAYDGWEQMGGAAARGPLFQFTTQPIGAHSGSSVLHSARGGGRRIRTNRGGGRLYDGATLSPVCLCGF